jgi:hypothetical protein
LIIRPVDRRSPSRNATTVTHLTKAIDPAPASPDAAAPNRQSSMNGVDAYLLRRLLVGQSLNGEADHLSPPFRGLAELMATIGPADRRLAWEGALAVRTDADEIRRAVLAADPDGSMPTVGAIPRFADIADVRRQRITTGWTWQSWIPSARIVGVAAFEGVGKTRFFMDLARRVWNGEEWPDGQAATFPMRTKTLWLCSDGHQDELVDIAADFGLPDEAIIFPAPDDDPYANTDLDDKDTWQWLDQAIGTVRPGLTFIDTLTYATTRDHCDQRSVASLKPQMVGLVQKHQANIILSLHVSREGQALGRRIKGLTRTLIHLECPDPDKPERLRLWVEKSYDKKPAALGVWMDASGNRYDSTPPPKVDPNKGGRPSAKRDKAMQFIQDALGRQNDQIGNDLCSEWMKPGESRNTFWRAVDDMVEGGEISTDGGPGTKTQTVLHLVQNPEP